MLTLALVTAAAAMPSLPTEDLAFLMQNSLQHVDRAAKNKGCLPPRPPPQDPLPNPRCKCPPKIDSKGGPEKQFGLEVNGRALKGVEYYYYGHFGSGQADVGELMEVYSKTCPYDFKSWGEQMHEQGQKLEARGRTLESKGDLVGAAGAYNRASTYYRAITHHSKPPNSKEPFGGHDGWENYMTKSLELFGLYLKLGRSDAKKVKIPYGTTTLPGYFFNAPTATKSNSRPVLMVNPGRDSKKEDLLFVCNHAVMRDYNCLLFEGPGQGEALIIQNLSFTPKWEVVANAAIDYLVEREPGVDVDRIGLFGNSMGGYLSLRAAAHAPRLSAVISDPATQDFFSSAQLDAMASMLCPTGWQQVAEKLEDYWTDKNETLNDWIKRLSQEHPSMFESVFMGAYQASEDMRQSLDYLAYIYGKMPLHQGGKVKDLMFGQVNGMDQYAMTDAELLQIQKSVLLLGSDFDYMAAAPQVFGKLCPGAEAEQCPHEQVCPTKRPNTTGIVTHHCFKSPEDGHCQPGALLHLTEVMFAWLHELWAPKP